MESDGRFTGTLRHIYAHWPTYAAAYGSIILLLVLVAISAAQGTGAGPVTAIIILSTVSLLVIGYFLVASLWAAHNLYDVGGLRPHHMLFDMAQLQSSDSLVYVDLGLRHQAIEIGRRLTTGKVLVIDVYKPQWTDSRALVRARGRMLHAPDDPRYEWYAADISLFPIPDGSVAAVILCQVLSNFWQDGDRLRLLKEVHRVLIPNGRVLVAERTRSTANWLVRGPAALALRRTEYWRALLAQADLRVRSDRDLGGLIHCFRADKPTPEEGQQLFLDLAM